MISPCPTCQNNNPNFLKKDGTFYRKSDSKTIQRYQCLKCKKRYSKATSHPCYRQNKRKLNPLILNFYCSGISLRRLSKNLGVNYKTVVRKVRFLSELARQSHQHFLEELKKTKVTELEFDDLLTSHHTKLKPLSVSLAVDANRRYILACEVSEIAAFGHLASISRKKYGKRISQHNRGLELMFEKIKDVVHPLAQIKSDEHKLYPKFVSRYFQEAHYERHKGGRGCVVGQGELKKLHHDPLFFINHTCAMLRANVNRLIRKTWCTTKDVSRLQDHLDLFIYYYNQRYLRDL